MNLVFGIIIDAFGDMRDSRKEQDEDIINKCFVCGINRFEFEVK
jgi:inositol 1,4,5-triphosphate receptor type 1